MKKYLAATKARLVKTASWVRTHSVHIMCTMAIICAIVIPPALTRALFLHDARAEQKLVEAHRNFVNAAEQIAHDRGEEWFRKTNPRTKLDEIHVYGVEKVGSHWECFVQFETRGKGGKVKTELKRFKCFETPTERLEIITEV